MARLYVPPKNWEGEEIILPESEGYHAGLVLRLGVGDRVELFNGRGRVAEGELVKVGKRETRVRVVAERQVERLGCGLHLILAMIKGERFDWAVQKATELGATSIRPVAADRSVVKLAGKDVEKRRAKWVQVSVEAAKQCGHYFLPEIFLPSGAAEAFQSAPSGERGIPALHPEGIGMGEFLVEGEGDVIFAIGPEGDWTEGELAAARGEGFRLLDLGTLVLRSETAALYVLSVAAQQRLGGVGGRKELL